MYLHEDKEQFIQAVNLTSYQLAVMERIVEKDYYVTMLLRLLAERMPFIVFKGGTSLSKCYKAILRFSEDIDIAVNIPLTQGQKKKLKYTIIDIVKELGLQILNLDETQSRKDYNQYVIAYSTALSQSEDMMQPTILIETSYTTISFPTVTLDVGSMIGDMMMQEAPDILEKYHMDTFEMEVQRIDRTLIDKVFAICDYYLQGNVKRHSRHIYDIYKLLPLVPQNENFKELIEEVRIVRKASNVCLSAQDSIDISVLLGKIIKEDTYRDDYQNVTMRLLEEEVNYDTAIGALEEIAQSGVF